MASPNPSDPKPAKTRSPILVVSDLAFAYGERVLFEGLSLALEPGDKLGLIGDNGVGKSSFLKLLLGLETPLRGNVALRSGTRVGVLEQVPELDLEATVRAVLEEGIGPRLAAIAKWEAATAAMDPSADALLTEIEHLGGFDYEHELQGVASDLELPSMERVIGTLSGGQRKRVAIARLVLSRPDLALFDEPTNHLDIETVEWLEKWIGDSAATCLVVTHDRAFLDRAVNKMAELRAPRRLVGAEVERGALAVYAGNYEDYLEARALEEEQRAALGQSRAQQLKTELEWSRRQPKARTTKSHARLGRVEALKDEVRDLGARELKTEIVFSDAPRLAKSVLALEGATFGYGGVPLCTNLDLALARGERLGVVGRNGIGKTSMLNALAGDLALMAGKRIVGSETKIAIFDQHRTVLDPKRSIQETVAPDGNDTVFPGGKPMHVAAWLARFAFTPKHLPMNVSALSGGERNRLALARFLLETANVLFFDEPTNDLDLATLGVLEDALVGFPGTIVVVSHDRWFLDRVATRMLVFEDLPPVEIGGVPRREVHMQPGGYTTYRRLRGPELEALRARYADLEREARNADKAAKKAASGRREGGESAPKRGLSGPEKKELQALEKSIERLEGELGKVGALLEDAAIWAGDGSKGREASAKKTALEAELEVAMERWGSLAERA
jgi:ATP-binding cassette subfamily F protein uup